MLTKNHDKDDFGFPRYNWKLTIGRLSVLVHARSERATYGRLLIVRVSVEFESHA